MFPAEEEYILCYLYIDMPGMFEVWLGTLLLVFPVKFIDVGKFTASRRKLPIFFLPCDREIQRSGLSGRQ